jgi:hypothetical protein
MAKKKNMFWLLAAGIGAFWYFRSKKAAKSALAPAPAPAPSVVEKTAAEEQGDYLEIGGCGGRC